MLKRKLLRLFILPFVSLNLMTGNLTSLQANDSAYSDRWLKKIQALSHFLTIENIERRHKDSSHFILHIRDIHSDPEAQLNIGKAIAKLARDFPADLGILLEGASGPLARPFQGERRLNEREKIAQRSVWRGWVTGAEYAVLKDDTLDSIPVLGIENEKAYLEDFFLYREAFGNQNKAAQGAGRIHQKIEVLAKRHFSEALLSLTNDEKAWLEQKMEWAVLFKKYRKLYPDFFSHAVFKQYFRILSLEKKINEVSLNSEIQAAVSRLTQTSRADRVKILLNKVLKHRLGKLDTESFIIFLVRELSRNAIANADFSNLLLCAKIFRLKRSLNSFQLMDKFNQSIHDIKESLAKTDEEKRILVLYEKAVLLSDLAKLELSQDGWKKWKKTDAGVFAELIGRDDVNLLLNELRPAEAFYEKARQRDEFFWKNFKSQTEAQDRPFWIIVTGGFHSDILEQNLDASGLNYAVAAPKMIHPVDSQIYQRLMLNEVIQNPLPGKMNAGVSSIVYPLLLGNLSPAASQWLAQTRLNILRAELLDALEGLEAKKGEDRKPRWKAKTDSDEMKRLINLFIQPKYGYEIAKILLDYLREREADETLIRHAEQKADELLGRLTASESRMNSLFKRLRLNVLRLMAAAAFVLAIPFLVYQTYQQAVPETGYAETALTEVRIPQTDDQFRELFPEFRFRDMNLLPEDQRIALTRRLEKVLQGPLGRLPSFLLYQSAIVYSGGEFRAEFMDGSSIPLESLEKDSAIESWLRQIAGMLRQMHDERAEEMAAGNAQDIENFLGSDLADGTGEGYSNLRRILSIYGGSFPAFERDLIRWFETEEIEPGENYAERLMLMADILVYWHLMSNVLLETAFEYEFPELSVEGAGLLSVDQRNILRSALERFSHNEGSRFPSSVLRLFKIRAVLGTGRDENNMIGLNFPAEARIFLPGDPENAGRPLNIMEDKNFSDLLFDRFAHDLFNVVSRFDPSAPPYSDTEYYAYSRLLGRSSAASEGMNIENILEVYGSSNASREVFGRDLEEWWHSGNVTPGIRSSERTQLIGDIFRHWAAMESEEGTFGPGTSLEILEQVAQFHYNEETQMAAVREIANYRFNPGSWREDARMHILSLMHVAYSNAPARVRSYAVAILADLMNSARGVVFSEDSQWDYVSYRFNTSLRAMSLELIRNPDLLQGIVHESHARAAEGLSYELLENHARVHLRNLAEQEENLRSMIRWDLAFLMWMSLGWGLLNFRDQEQLAYLIKLFIRGLREGYIRERALREIYKLIGMERLLAVWNKIKAAVPEFRKFDDDVIWEIQMIKAEEGNFRDVVNKPDSTVHFEGALLYSELAETGPFIRKRNVTELSEVQTLIAQRLRTKERYADHRSTLKRMNAEAALPIKEWVSRITRHKEIRVPTRDGHFIVLYVENEILDHFPENQVKVLLQWAMSMDRSLHGTDFKTLDQPIVVALLDQSPYMMMDHAGNNFIGINRALLQVPEGPLRDILFQLGMVHEIRHEATRGQNISESDFALQDQALRKELVEGRSYDERQWAREIFSMGVLDGRSPILRVPYTEFIRQINDAVPGNQEKLLKFYDMKIFPKAGIGLDELTEDAREILEEIPIAALSKLADKLGLNFGAPGINLSERIENGRKLFSLTLSELKKLCGPDITLEFPRLAEEAFRKKLPREHVLDAMVRLAKNVSPWTSSRTAERKPIRSFEGAPLNKQRYAVSRFIGKKGVAEIGREQQWALKANLNPAEMINRFNRDVAKAIKLRIQEKGKHQVVLVELGRQRYLKLLVDNDIIERWGAARVEKLVREALRLEAEHNHTDISGLKGPIVVGLLGDAPHLMADHFSNGFIGIHRALFDLPDGIVRDVLFQVGFMHELRHELQDTDEQWGDTEREFLVKDLILKRAILEQQQYNELRWNIQVMYSDVLDTHASILRLGAGYYAELDAGIAGNEKRAREFFDKMIAPAAGVSFDVLSAEAQEILQQIPLPKLASLANAMGLHFGVTGPQSYTFAAEYFSQFLVDIFKLQGYRIYLNWNDMVTRSRAAFEKGLYPNLFDAMKDMARASDQTAAPHYQVGEVPVPHEEVVNPSIRQKMENVVTHYQKSNRIEKREEAQRALDLTPFHYDSKEGVVILQFSKMVDVPHHLLQEAKKYAVLRTPGFLGKNPAAVQPIHDILLGLHGVFASYPELANQYRNMRLVISLKDFTWGSYAGSHALFHFGSAGRDLPTVYASGPVLLRLSRQLLNENLEAENALRAVMTHEWMHSQGKGEAEAARVQKEMDKTDYLGRLAGKMIEENRMKAEKNLEQSAEYLALRRMVLEGNLIWAENFLRGLITMGKNPEDIHKMVSKLLSSGEVFYAPAVELLGGLKDVIELGMAEKTLIEDSFSSYRRSILSFRSEIAGFFRANDSLTIDFKNKTVLMKKPYSGFKTFQIPDSLLQDIEADQKDSITVDSLDHLQSAFEARWMTAVGRKSDVFFRAYIREDALGGIVDAVEKQALVLDLDLIKKEKEGDLLMELREIIRKLPKNVEMIVMGAEDQRSIAEILAAEGGLKASDLKKVQIYSYGSRGRGVDEWIIDRLLKEGKAGDLSQIKFIGTKENLDHGLYGDYLRAQAKHGLTSVFGDGKNSLAQLVVMVFEAKDMVHLKKVLHQAGFNDEEIENLMPEDGKIPPLPVAGAFTDSLKENYQTQRMIEAAA